MLFFMIRLINKHKKTIAYKLIILLSLRNFVLQQEIEQNLYSINEDRNVYFQESHLSCKYVESPVDYYFEFVF